MSHQPSRKLMSIHLFRLTAVAVLLASIGLGSSAFAQKGGKNNPPSDPPAAAPTVRYSFSEIYLDPAGFSSASDVNNWGDVVGTAQRPVVRRKVALDGTIVDEPYMIATSFFFHAASQFTYSLEENYFPGAERPFGLTHTYDDGTKLYLPVTQISDTEAWRFGSTTTISDDWKIICEALQYVYDVEENGFVRSGSHRVLVTLPEYGFPSTDPTDPTTWPTVEVLPFNALDRNSLGDLMGVVGTGVDQFAAVLPAGGTLNDFVNIGHLGVSSEVHPRAINIIGDVAGTARPEGSSSMTAFLYTELTGIMDLGTVKGNQGSSAEDINDSGDVVGQSRISNGSQAFRYRNGKMEDLGSLAKGYAIATGINNAGDVVGSSERQPFLYLDEFGMHDLETLVGNLTTEYPEYVGTLAASNARIKISDERLDAQAGSSYITGTAYSEISKDSRAWLLTPVLPQ